MRRMSIVSLSILAAVVVSLSVVSGETLGEKAEVQGKSKGLTFQLDAGKRVFRLFEPVTVSYRLMNKTSSPIVTITDLSLMRHDVELSIQEGERAPEPYLGGLIADGITDPRSFEPGRVEESTVTMLFAGGSADLAFPRVGSYTVRGRVFTGNPKDIVYADAEPVKVEVAEPLKVDVELANRLGSTDRMLFLFKRGLEAYCGGRDRGECVRSIRQDVLDLEGSAYAPHVAQMLAWSIGFASRDPQSRNLVLSGEILKDFLSRWPGHDLEGMVMFHLAETLREQGKKDEAVMWKGRYAAKYPSRQAGGASVSVPGGP